MLAIVALEAVPDDDETRTAARALTAELRGATAARFELGTPPDVASCPSDDMPSCTADAADRLGVAFVLYGRVEHAGEGFSLQLDLLDVDKRASQRATLVWVASDPRSAARDALAKLRQAR